ncbi:HAD hydrolase-like protein [Clostridium sp. CF012]|nr:HAD hydrolase-like protein [Clostridium sp. CF012]
MGWKKLYSNSWRKFNTKNSSALVIGDRECEILGGNAAGIRVCLYNTNNIEFNEAQSLLFTTPCF